jgi:Tfp pilus assembly protein PilO
MGNFKIKKQLIIAGLVLILGTDVALMYLNAKLSSPVGNRQQVLAAQSRQLALVKEDVRRASVIREKIPQTLKEFDEFEATLLPASKGSSAITQEMAQYAHDTHLVMDDMRVHGKEVSGRNLSEMTVDATVNGDYNGIVSFLNRLQRSKNVYIVDSLALDTDASTQGPAGALRVNLHMHTYFRKA